MAVTVIESNTPIDTEQHFLVKAGPGAGKTYWLIQHIKHVLSTSNRLGKIKKIAPDFVIVSPKNLRQIV